MILDSTFLVDLEPETKRRIAGNATMENKGKLIGANDIWIAATALANSEKLVTRNEAEFGRVQGLAAVAY